MSETDETRQDAPKAPPETPTETPPPETPAPQQPPAPVRRRGARLALLLALLGVLLAGGGIGAGYWAWLQLQQQSAQRNQTLDDLSTRVEALRTRIGGQASQHAVDTLKGQLDALGRQVQAQTQTLDTLKRAVEEERKLAQRDQRGWTVAEIEYLMRVARYRLDLMRDYHGSIAALQAADRRLASLADPNLLPVRQALAKEIAALRDFKKPDRVGIMLELAQIATHVETLPPARPALGGAKVGSPAQPAPAAGWRGFLDAVWTAISKHITVRHYDQPVQGAPAAETLLYLNQVLRLRLEAARVAVMRGDDAEYHSELKAALSWLDAHYAPQPVKSLKQQLAALLARDIAPPPPDISRSLTLLRHLVAADAQPQGAAS